MALKPITLRLDEEEYERLKQYLHKFGDPDINVAYVLRAYIRDLNRVLPYVAKSDWDLKNYFGMMGLWLKQFVSVGDFEMFSKMTVNPWPWPFPSSTTKQGRGTASSAEQSDESKDTNSSNGQGGDEEK